MVRIKRAIIFSLLATCTAVANSQTSSLATWSSATSGALGGANISISFTQFSYLDTVNYSSLFPQQFTFSSVSNIPGYLAGSTVNISFSKPINVSLYTIYWRGPVGGSGGVANTSYTLTSGGSLLPALKIISGASSASVTGGNTYTTPSTSFASNVLYLGRISQLDISPLLDAGGFQGLTFGIIGPLSSDTQDALQLSANRLKSVYTLQTSTITNGMTYDCNVFDKNGICVSAGGRYNRVNTGDTRSGDGLLIGAYRVSPTIRVGAWVDENLFPSTGVGIRLSNGQPMFGVFGVWNASSTGEGFEARVSAGYGNKDLTITRDVIGTSEPGKGTTNLNTQGVSAVISYNYPVNATWTASPYLGARHTKLKSGAYTEQTSDAVTTPLTFSELKQESTTALAGIKLSGKLMPSFGVFGGVGAELDTSSRGNNYSATGVDGLTPIAFNPNIKRLRGSANAGFYLDIDKTQRLSLSTVYREEAFQNTNTLSSMLMYTAGF